MGKYKVFNGTDWVDICDCNVHIRNANDVWQLVDPNNCLVRYWTGTEWCEVNCCQCAAGFTLDEATGDCSKLTRLPATPSGGTFYNIIPGIRNEAYGKFGALLYTDITFADFPLNGFGNYTVRDNAGTGTLYTATASDPNNNIFNTQNTYDTKGRLNYCGIWGQGYADNVWFTVRFCVTITTAKTYIFALAGDNEVRANITSTTFNGGATDLNLVNLWDSNSPSGTPKTLNGRPFNYWFMFPIELPVGDHVFELSGYNFGSDYAFGAEVYDISITDLQALMASTTATPADFNPYVIFTTANLVQNPPLRLPAPGETGITYTCPAGSTFTDCYGAPQCVVTKSYPCEGVLTCQSGSLTGSGGSGIYKVPLLVPAEVCDVQIIFQPYGVADSLAIMNFDETILYAQTGYFGGDGPSVNPVPLGSFVFGPSSPRKIYKYTPGTGTNFTEDTTAPNQTLEVIANEFPITNTDPNKIPRSYDPAAPTQQVRTITWNKGITANDVMIMIRIVGHPTEGTGWLIQALTCVDCSFN